MADDDDLVAFVDEEPPQGTHADGSAMPCWRVLVVDDDPDVHETTKFALQGVIVHNRPLQLLDAYTAAEGLQVLAHEPDIAVVLLDVVMETQDAGLRAVEAIRNELKLPNVRIILRTGQPGYAPEMEAVSRYDINDYKTKSELTRIKLFTALTGAIRAYDQLQRIEAGRAGLEKMVESINRFLAPDGLGVFAEGVILQMAGTLGIDPGGLICVARIADNGEEPEYRVIAAAGRHARLIHQPMSAITDPAIHQSLACCFRARRTLVDDRSLTLFCPGRDDHDFAAYAECVSAVRAVDRRLIEVFCSNIGLFAESVRHMEKLQALAYGDPLTGLPNAHYFLEQIDADRGGARQVLALLSVDDLAGTAEVLGPAYGDLMVKAVARRLQDELNGRVLLARLGGCSFGIFGHELIVRPDYLRSLFRPRVPVDDVELPLSISLGLVRRDDMPQACGSDLLRFAELALKQAKRTEPGHWVYSSRPAAGDIQAGGIGLRDLRRALADDGFVLQYQPQIALATGQVIGAEALLRLRLPDGRLARPQEFMALAEQSGLMVDLGRWVLLSALQGLRMLQSQRLGNLRMTVNVASIEFRQPDFLEAVDDALRVAGVMPHQLELDVCEPEGTAGVDFLARRIQALRARDIGVALDEFGAGSGAVCSLDRLRPNRLKVARSVVALGESARLGTILLSAGKELGMRVLAEGVEDAHLAELVGRMGYDDAQGYHYARPMSLEDLTNWLKS
ncbi:MAG: EAL domain-containing protein [Methylococcaceae bacterium]|nr:EAL domain-containing protein [Methylococcaceae bacterium]